ncbi:MAG: hypothetical protein DI551_01735 [Micavibrio aeruginosavorus]|uniref:Uncharacterized protein n=1 Tax=Micavibrio aeruginosavorus TaxID=349221 RepID=A0A2W5NBX5_9BACT|nr:MAG: hypothetical protein DI551_01735 [Micavibrio aeruginosavorus]
MRVQIKDLMDKLGVGYVLSRYETCPWSAYDPEKGITAMAEVRMNNEGDEVEAEIQFLYDNPEDGKPPVEQMVFIYAKPVVSGQWSPTIFQIRRKDETIELYGWEEKCCNFFRACIQDIKMDIVPDIDEIAERELGGDERFRDARRGGGSKAPKIKPQALLGMKNGRGF